MERHRYHCRFGKVGEKYSFYSLISCRYFPLIKPTWMLAGKGDVVWEMQSAGALRHRLGQKRMDLSMGHIIFVAATHLCHCRVKASVDNK